MPPHDTGSAATSSESTSTRTAQTAVAAGTSSNGPKTLEQHPADASDGPSAPISRAQENPAADEKPKTNNTTSNMTSSEPPELDDFGLPIPKYTASQATDYDYDSGPPAGKKDIPSTKASASSGLTEDPQGGNKTPVNKDSDSDSDQEFKDAVSGKGGSEGDSSPQTPVPTGAQINPLTSSTKDSTQPEGSTTGDQKKPTTNPNPASAPERERIEEGKGEAQEDQAIAATKQDLQSAPGPGHTRDASTTSAAGADGGSKTFVSEFSHQQLTTQKAEKDDAGEGEWQEMPAYAPYDIYDDDNKLIAREHTEEDDEKDKYGYAGLGGAGKGYTKVLLDDDAESATSMDENTSYLFKEKGTTAVVEDDETQRDAVSQLQATKELLTEGQRIAYVGLTRLELSVMVAESENVERTRKTKKELNVAAENMKMWSQKMMIRLYSHMDISPDEQIMIEQLSAHGVMPKDLTPVLMVNARVKNPMAEDPDKASLSSGTKSLADGAKSPASAGTISPRPSSSFTPETEEVAEPPPPYEVNDDSELTAPVRTPSQMPTTQKIDIDLRWTVLCDLFLVLIADSIYDARSRVLLERVAKSLEIPWLDICRFEKKVTDALEMQQNAEKENWNEEDHMETRRKMNLKKRYLLMGLATVGGGLVIGLSAGLLAPMIGAGLATGFTAIGVGGTSGFLAGAGGAAIITSSAATTGGIIGVRAANRRTGSVKTFEYRPLHNNKRVNLIVTVSGWMTGKVDDVRLPFSTVDPVMGDIYSVLWEPEMLTSMGETINILATEALTQGLQQILASTVLFGLMSALQLPIVLTKLSYLIDNPWTVSLDRATMAGKILADSLIDRNLGTRPITLVGYSLGSRVIFSCLLELAKKGAYGLIQNVYLFGSPVVVKQDEYIRARSVVAGRFLSGYNRSDWILGYLFRLTNGGIRRVAGLAPIEDIPGLENMDVSEFVVGHMDYRVAMPRLLRECGWNVENDEFTEIEDPDPEQHQERQRELINEIEEARKGFEKEGKGKKGGFSFFRKKKVQKQDWEIYEDASKAGGGVSGGSAGGRTEDKEGNNHGVLFDIDAIRAELAREQQEGGKNGKPAIEEEMLQVREIKSTLPPMKLDLSPGLPSSPMAARATGGLRESRSVSLSAVPSRSSSAFAQDPWGGDSAQQHSRQQSQGGYRLSDERTQTYPMDGAEERTSHPYHAYGHGGPNGGGGFGGRNDDDEIQLTFDTTYNDRGPKSSSPTTAPSYSNSANTNGGSHSHTPSIGGAKPETSGAVTPTALPSRPGIRSSKTEPSSIPPPSNPWANISDYDDDDDFGKEKEISMTFA